MHGPAFQVCVKPILPPCRASLAVVLFVHLQESRRACKGECMDNNGRVTWDIWNKSRCARVCINRRAGEKWSPSIPRLQVRVKNREGLRDTPELIMSRRDIASTFLLLYLGWIPAALRAHVYYAWKQKLPRDDWVVVQVQFVRQRRRIFQVIGDTILAQQRILKPFEEEKEEEPRTSKPWELLVSLHR